MQSRVRGSRPNPPSRKTLTMNRFKRFEFVALSVKPHKQVKAGRSRIANPRYSRLPVCATASQESGVVAELEAGVGFEHGFEVGPVGFVHVIKRDEIYGRRFVRKFGKETINCGAELIVLNGSR